MSWKESSETYRSLAMREGMMHWGVHDDCAARMLRSHGQPHPGRRRNSRILGRSLATSLATTDGSGRGTATDGDRGRVETGRSRWPGRRDDC